MTNSFVPDYRTPTGIIGMGHAALNLREEENMKRASMLTAITVLLTLTALAETYREEGGES